MKFILQIDETVITLLIKLHSSEHSGHRVRPNTRRLQQNTVFSTIQHCIVYNKTRYFLQHSTVFSTTKNCIFYNKTLYFLQ